MGPCPRRITEALPDGTYVVTTYRHWVEGEEPFVVSVRFTLEELDAKARGSAPEQWVLPPRHPSSPPPEPAPYPRPRSNAPEHP